MTDSKHYVIRGGIEGRERLRILARVMQPTTCFLLDRLGLQDGLACLDVGCGGGDVTLELARRVAPRGRVVGADIDGTKLELARREAQQQEVANVEFLESNVCEDAPTERFDLVYARFLLTHLSDPVSAVSVFYRSLRPGGRVAVEDIDFSGYFAYPPCPALRRYQELYSAAVTRRGGDPNIGPRLPLLLKEAGFDEVAVNVVQPVGLTGEVKLINPITMENIADAVLQDNLATRAEIDEVVRELYDFAADPRTVAGVPRVIQSWGRRPGGDRESEVGSSRLTGIPVPDQAPGARSLRLAK